MLFPFVYFPRLTPRACGQSSQGAQHAQGLSNGGLARDPSTGGRFGAGPALGLWGQILESHTVLPDELQVLHYLLHCLRLWADVLQLMYMQ